MKAVVGRSLTYIDGEWLEGNPPVLGPMTHATWLASFVFDGARAFDGYAPDLDLHCHRCVESAENMGLSAVVDAVEIERLSWEGIHQFPDDAELYVRPMFYGTEGFMVPEPSATAFMLSVYEAQIPDGEQGFTACRTTRKRPLPEMAPTDAKCAALYPNVSRMFREATAKGFVTAVVFDHWDNVAEFANANLFMVKDGIVHTPEINGTFLNGITRQRVINLLRKSGTEVRERVIKYEELLDADEVFSSGNWAKVQTCSQIEEQHFQPGPMFRSAREGYWAWARTTPRK